MKQKLSSTLFKAVLLSVLFCFPVAGSSAPVKKLLDRPIVLAHVSASCEDYFFAAEKLGLFEKNGLEVELLRANFNSIKEGIASGKVDVTDGLLQKWLKPIEQGLDIKFTLGVHQGCSSAVVKTDSPYKSVKDLKGKTIGVAGTIGDAAMNYMYRVIIAEGLDPVKDFEWVAFDAGALIAALETGKADVVVGGDANTYAKIKTGEFSYIARMATDEYFKDEVCCLLAFSPSFIKEHRDIALVITKIMHEAALYNGAHKEEMVRYAHEKGYINGTLEDNIEIVKPFTYNPGVKIALHAFEKSFRDYQASGIIDKDVELKTVLDRAFVIFDDPDIQ
ncbi:nitrate ABC transporter substrate-binding protein [Synergistales bacterium]|nr:nitrate ABC transporter substrate-binding protein [Synergistales bacterium]